MADHKRVGTAGRHRLLVFVAVVFLIGAFAAQVALSARRSSLTWDEADHIFAGYRSWTHRDFGLNPEHPPLVKLVAALPLLALRLKAPAVLRSGNFKSSAFLDGRDFVFGNNADLILARARLAASLFAIALALLVFVMARAMFGAGAALLALALLVFEPNILAHAPYVTTDTALSLFLAATVYAFYGYVKAPSLGRMVVMGLTAGGALASKHTGLLVFPILALLAVFEAARTGGPGRWMAALRQAGKLAAPIVGAGVLAVALLWASYGFRYQARPQGLTMNPPLDQFVERLRPFEARTIRTLAEWKLLPESYLYGMVDVRLLAVDGYPSYVLGKTYPKGVWFYFPVAFAIKSTVAFLALLLLAAGATASGKLRCGREVAFLAIPALLHLAVAMSANLNIGVRHILPLYVFFSILIAGGAWALLRSDRRWAYLVAGLLVFHGVSSARGFPVYLAYANELWGGPSHTYQYLSDSNTDWAQQLKSVKQVLDQRHVKSCWFAYFAGGVADTSYYGIPCKMLPVISTEWLDTPMEAEPEIEGPVLVSAGTLSGFEFGPGALNPYDQFQKLRPTAVIDHGVFVYDGHFQMPLAAAKIRMHRARALSGDPVRALAEAEAAVAICPDCVEAQTLLGVMYQERKLPAEARRHWEKALALAQLLEPGYREPWVAPIRARLDAAAADPP